MTIYAVTGATGALGHLAVENLVERGIEPRELVAVVRDATKAAPLAERGLVVRVADYSDPDALSRAFDGIDRLLFISGSEIGARIAQHSAVVDAAAAAHVGLIAYTSVLKADSSGLQLAAEHVATEQAIAASGVPHILLRNGWYSENYIPSLAPALESGVLYGAAGDGRLAPAARADFAAAAAAALIAGDAGVFELAGDEHVTYADLAATIADVSGRPVRYQDLPEAEYAAALRGAGLPDPVAAMLADSDAGVARGELDSTSTDLVDLIGRPTTPLAEVIRAAV